MTDAIEALCKRINEHRPGDPFTHEHSLAFIADLISENGAVSALLQRCWCRKAKEKAGQPGRLKTGAFGLLAVGRQRPASGRAARRRIRLPVADQPDEALGGEDEDEAVPLTGFGSYTYTPTSAYDIFAHNEAAKLRKEGRALTAETWRAVGAAWRALSTERQAVYKQQLLANVTFANSRLLSSRCAYQCPVGASGLAHCEGCDRADVSGHPECFLARLEQRCGDDGHACEACYLCPRCLQQHLRALCLEPPAPSEAQLAAIERLVGGQPLQVQLAGARNAGLQGAARVVLEKHVEALRLLADDARLQDSSAYANVHGAVNGLLIAEFFRDGSRFAIYNPAVHPTAAPHSLPFIATQETGQSRCSL